MAANRKSKIPFGICIFHTVMWRKKISIHLEKSTPATGTPISVSIECREQVLMNIISMCSYFIKKRHICKVLT